MDDKTTALLEKLADKLGTTAEHLWSVLVAQAPVSGAVDLALVLAAISAAAGFTWRAWRGLQKITDSDGLFGPEHKVVAVCGTAVAAVFAAVVALLLVLTSAHGIAAAFLNPEYWALERVLRIVQ